MKNIESFILEILENHPCTESTLTKEVSILYPISICFFHDGSLASPEVRITLSKLFDDGKILILSDQKIATKDNQRF